MGCILHKVHLGYLKSHSIIPQQIFLGCLKGRILDTVSFFALRFANQPFGKDSFFWVFVYGQQTWANSKESIIVTFSHVKA